MLMLLIADAVSPAVSAGFDASAITPVVSAVGSLGFAIWFAWYTTVYTLPALQKEHRDERAQAQAVFAQTVKDLVEEMKSSREMFDRWKMKA